MTGSFDEVVLLDVVYGGEVATAVATVVGSGTCSMLVRVECCVHRDGIDVNVVRGLVTFVAVGKEGGSRKLGKMLGKVWLWWEGEKVCGTEMLGRFKIGRKLFMHGGRAELERVGRGGEKWETRGREGRVELGKQFLPRHRNMAGNVFGGDIVETLGEAAVEAGKRGMGGRVGVVVGVCGLAFLRPVEERFVLRVEGKLVCWRGRFATVVVRAALDLKHDGSEMALAQVGVFHIVMLDGEEVEVGTSLQSNHHDEDDLHLDFYRTLCTPLPASAKSAWSTKQI